MEGEVLVVDVAGGDEWRCGGGDHRRPFFTRSLTQLQPAHDRRLAGRIEADHDDAKLLLCAGRQGETSAGPHQVSQRSTSRMSHCVQRCNKRQLDTCVCPLTLLNMHGSSVEEERPMMPRPQAAGDRCGTRMEATQSGQRRLCRLGNRTPNHSSAWCLVVTFSFLVWLAFSSCARWCRCARLPCARWRRMCAAAGRSWGRLERARNCELTAARPTNNRRADRSGGRRNGHGSTADEIDADTIQQWMLIVCELLSFVLVVLLRNKDSVFSRARAPVEERVLVSVIVRCASRARGGCGGGRSGGVRRGELGSFGRSFLLGGGEALLRFLTRSSQVGQAVGIRGLVRTLVLTTHASEFGTIALRLCCSLERRLLHQSGEGCMLGRQVARSGRGRRRRRCSRRRQDQCFGCRCDSMCGRLGLGCGCGGCGHKWVEGGCGADNEGIARAKCGAGDRNGSRARRDGRDRTTLIAIGRNSCSCRRRSTRRVVGRDGRCGTGREEVGGQTGGRGGRSGGGGCRGGCCCRCGSRSRCILIV